MRVKIKKRISSKYRFASTFFRGLINREQFSDVNTFLLFLGAPRSGHTLISEFINAHRNAHISRKINGGFRYLCKEQYYQSCIDFKEDMFRHRYYVPGQYQGTYLNLNCVGMRNATVTTEWYGSKLSRAKRLSEYYGIPVKFVHVYRDPIENIAKISRYNKLSIIQAANWYVSLISKTRLIENTVSNGTFYKFCHEDLYDKPSTVLSNLLRYLQLEEDEALVDSFSKIIWDSPSVDVDYLEVKSNIPLHLKNFIASDPLLGRYSL